MLDLSLFTKVAEAAPQNVNELILKVNEVIINPLIGLVSGIAFVLFLFGVVRFLIYRSTNSEEAQKGKRHMFWGIIGLFIMLGVFGIMKFLANTVGSSLL